MFRGGRGSRKGVLHHKDLKNNDMNDNSNKIRQHRASHVLET